MSECEVVYRAGPPSSVQIGSLPNGDRSAALTFPGGPRRTHQLANLGLAGIQRADQLLKHLLRADLAEEVRGQWRHESR